MASPSAFSVASSYVRQSLRMRSSKGSSRARSTSPEPRSSLTSRGCAPSAEEMRKACSKAIAFVLKGMADSTESMADDFDFDCEDSSMPFSCSPGMVPSISIEDYVARIMTYTPWHVELYTAALLYIDRVLEMNKGLVLDNRNVHRLFATSVMVASKLLDDLYYTNRYFATIAGVSNDEMNSLELQLLQLAKFNTAAPTQIISDYVLRIKILATIALEQDLGDFFCEEVVCRPGVETVSCPTSMDSDTDFEDEILTPRDGARLPSSLSQPRTPRARSNSFGSSAKHPRLAA